MEHVQMSNKTESLSLKIGHHLQLTMYSHAMPLMINARFPPDFSSHSICNSTGFHTPLS